MMLLSCGLRSHYVAIVPHPAVWVGLTNMVAQEPNIYAFHELKVSFEVRSHFACLERSIVSACK